MTTNNVEQLMHDFLLL